MPLQPIQDPDHRFKHLLYDSSTRVPIFPLASSPLDDKENVPRGAGPKRSSRKRGRTPKGPTGTNKLALSSKAALDSGKPAVPVARRNERERNRVKLLNLGFARLRAVVPSKEGEQLSKISTLKKAIWYIEHLDRVLNEPLEDDADDANDRVNYDDNDNRRIGVVGTDLGFAAGSSSNNFTAYPTISAQPATNASRCQAAFCEKSSPAKPKFPSPILPERCYYSQQQSYCESDTDPRRALNFLTPVRRPVDTGPGDSGYGSSIHSSGPLLSREKLLPYGTASPYNYTVAVTSSSTPSVAVTSCPGWNRLGEISPLMTPTSSPSAPLQWSIFEPTMR